MEPTVVWELVSGLPTAAVILYIWIVSNKDRGKEQDAWRAEFKDSSALWREDIKLQNEGWRSYMSEKNEEWRSSVQRQNDIVNELISKYGKEKRD